MPNCPRPTAAALAAICLLFAGQTLAVDYCVGTIPELRQALNDAEADGLDSVVRMRAGVYTISADVEYDTRPSEFFLNPGAVSLRGGYNLDCSAETGKSEITSSNDSDVILSSTSGSIDVRSLSFIGADLFLDDERAGECGTVRTFALDRVFVSNALVNLTAECNKVYVSNSLFNTGVPRFGNYDELSLRLDFDNPLVVGAHEATLVNVTIRNGTLGTSQNRPARVAIYNSIFENDAASGEILNFGCELRIFNSRYVFLENVGDGSLVLSANNTTANPSLNAASVPNAGSPVIDAGLTSVPGGLGPEDVYRQDRVKGARVDMGAAESPFDLNGI